MSALLSVLQERDEEPLAVSGRSDETSQDGRDDRFQGFIMNTTPQLPRLGFCRRRVGGCNSGKRQSSDPLPHTIAILSRNSG
jgi:hypothetical protein